MTSLLVLLLAFREIAATVDGGAYLLSRDESGDVLERVVLDGGRLRVRIEGAEKIEAIATRGDSLWIATSDQVIVRATWASEAVARVEIPDRRSNRQHLGSVHAIALMNVAEMTSGLAMMSGLPDGVRGIVTSLSMEYYKKARGTITAVSRVSIPTVTDDQDFDVTAACLDAAGAVVAKATVRWRLGPVRPKPDAGAAH